ncbi:hypothetical protein EXIGLDRAFT_774142 [Exidia glandulosa HHB12029]|uniref:F-box domain-containing protein n=1 Tax=Exidia glandulosa HHB12029 TaxID=1314781 RepID=A0A165EHE1_EXIGL|nr:hypothetical protein EXIGLDRAFT_774142 [Exidia glandulosa HHB12029]
MPLALPFLRPKRRIKDPAAGDDERGLASALAPELLLKILQYLTEPNLRHLPPRPHRRALYSVPLVCKRWNGPGNEALYKRVYLLSHDAGRAMLRTLRKRPAYGHLIQGICFCPPPPIAVILEGKVTKLSLWNISVVHPSTTPKGHTHTDVLKQASRITELCLETSAVNDVRLKYEFPVGVGWAPASTLRILSVRGDYNGPYPSSFVHLLTALGHASARNVEDLTMHSYQFRDGNPPETWEGSLPPLKRLRLTHCHISPEMFALLARACVKTLRVLEIIDCQVLSRSANFVSILASLTGLRKLSIGRGLPFGADMAGLTGLKVLSLDDYVCSHAHFIGAYPPQVEEIRVHIWWGPELGTKIAADYIRSCTSGRGTAGGARLAHLKRVELRVYSRFADLERWRIMAVCLAGFFAPLPVRTKLMIVREEEEEDPVAHKFRHAQNSSSSSSGSKIWHRLRH